MHGVALNVCEEITLARAAADAIARALSRTIALQGEAVWTPSAGRTPTLTYRFLRQDHRQSLDWGAVRLVQMDEYLGLPPHHPASLAFYINRHVAEPLGIRDFACFNGDDGTLRMPPERFEQIHAARIDLAVHGVGRNGHIGFNEPGSSPTSLSRTIMLDASTYEDNFANAADRARFRSGVTLGLRALLGARDTVVLATGRHKAAAVCAMLAGPVSKRCPASFLRRSSGVTAFLDSAAHALLAPAREARLA